MFRDKLNEYHKKEIKRLRDDLATLEQKNSSLERENEQLKRALELMKKLQDETLKQYQNDIEEMRNVSVTVREVVKDTLLERKNLEEKIQDLTKQLDDIRDNAVYENVDNTGY